MEHLAPSSLFFRHASQLLTLAGPAGPRRGKALSELGIISKGAILTHGVRILAIGSTRAVEAKARRLKAEAIDCRGAVVMPGFVDSHTHLVFAGSRVSDYEARLRICRPPPLLAPQAAAAKTTGTTNVLRWIGQDASPWGSPFRAYKSRSWECRNHHVFHHKRSPLLLRSPRTTRIHNRDRRSLARCRTS